LTFSSQPPSPPRFFMRCSSAQALWLFLIQFSSLRFNFEPVSYSAGLMNSASSLSGAFQNKCHPLLPVRENRQIKIRSTMTQVAVRFLPTMAYSSLFQINVNVKPHFDSTSKNQSICLRHL
ncbi:hypothetical protein CPB86DRAFT_779064, partial [Serendipita vermifera]